MATRNARNLLRPPQLKQVDFKGGFWGPRLRANRDVTLPIELQQCEKTGRIGAFSLNWKEGQPNKPHMYWDSDVAKWLEAAAYSLATHPDAELEARVDAVVELIAAAQQPDGYLNVFFTLIEPEKRFTHLRDNHELYCAGHLMEAAVAYAHATGKRKLLEVMCRYADLIDTTFGPREGQKRGYCGHPEIELALVKLYRATGEKRYLDLAHFFVTERGKQPHYYDVEAIARGEDPAKEPRRADGYSYYQAHAPIQKQRDIEGHAVRALYLAAGVVDVAQETGDRALLAAGKRLWQSATRRRMYITGGVGSSPTDERFTTDYDLPNETAYAETCANIALVFLAHRLLQVEPDAEYADVMERALYNSVLSGVSLSGDRFRYGNPLTVHDYALSDRCPGHRRAERQEWFGCACCPPNIARLLASLGSYVYSTTPGTLYTHLYAGGSAQLDVGGRRVSIEQETDYPWDERISMTIHVDVPTHFALALRIPGWCAAAKLKVNGKAMRVPPLVRQGYAYIDRQWEPGDVVELTLPMPIERIEANPRSRNNLGKVALQRGPIIYCLEQVDNGQDLAAIILPAGAKLSAAYQPRLLGGCVVLTGEAKRVTPEDWPDALYRPIGRGSRTNRVQIKAVPYGLWGNRKVGEMVVWLQHER